MTTQRPGLGELAVQAACAFAEAFLGEKTPAGSVQVPLEQAHVFASGRVDLWNGWSDLQDEYKSLIGRFLRLRHNELASRERFLEAARRMSASPEAPYALAASVDPHKATHAEPRHGQAPLALAQHLVTEMEAEHASRRGPLPVAGSGLWSFGGRGHSVVELPEGLDNATSHPMRIDTAPATAEVKVGPDELVELATDLDHASGGDPWRASTIRGLLEGLRDSDGVAVGQLLARAGRLEVMNAPTGVGKSVLMRLVAIVLARRGLKVALVGSDINAALSTRDELEADIEKLSSQKELSPLSCAALMSPTRLHDKTRAAADVDDWHRVDQLGYGCTLKAFVTDGPPPQAGQEPCRDLRLVEQATGQGSRGNGKGSSRPKQHACPWRDQCGRHRLSQQAAQADIIVTYHHYFAGGQPPLPARVDGVDVDRISAMELIMRRCSVILVDEIDQLQSALVSTGSQEVPLASKGPGAAGLPLDLIETDRDMLPAGADRQVLPPLLRTRFLAEQFLNYVLDNELWLEEQDRPSSGWHLPGGNDRFLLKELFAVPEEMEDVPDSVYRSFNALFTDRGDIEPGDLPVQLAPIRDLVAEAVSGDAGADHIQRMKHDLQEALPDLVTDSETRARVVNALLVRAWLGALRQSLTRLTYAVTTPDTQLPAARQLADKLGVFVQRAAIPYGPLGYLLFGFHITRTEDPEPRGTLSAQAFAEDPHTTVTQLGDVMALAAAGVPRIVVGLSATAFFPGAAREHVHAPVTWAMTDATSGAVTASAGTVLGDARPIRVAGVSENAKGHVITELGRELWNQRLESHLTRLGDDPERKDRARLLLVANSYRHCALLAHGLAQATDAQRLAVAVSPAPTGPRADPPTGALSLTADQFETFPHYDGVDILIAPLSRVARGLNILIPGQQRSAIAEIWLCVRPVAQLTEPAEMFASINAHGVAAASADAHPAAALAAQRKAAHSRLHKLLCSDPRFSLLPRHLKAEVVAGMLVDLIQLAGRARRGGTSVDLYLVDAAFHDQRLGSDLPSLVRFHYETLPASEKAAMRRVYGHTLTSLLTFAGLPMEEIQP